MDGVWTDRDLRAAGAGAVGFALIYLAAQLLRLDGIDPSLGVLLTLLVLPVAVAIGGALPARVLGYDWPLAVIASISAHATMLLVGFGLAGFIPLATIHTVILGGSAVVTMIILITDRLFIQQHIALTFAAVALVLFWLMFAQPIHHIPGALLCLIAWVAAPAATSMLERLDRT
jgi:hypothetical protein